MVVADSGRGRVVLAHEHQELRGIRGDEHNLTALRQGLVSAGDIEVIRLGVAGPAAASEPRSTDDFPGLSVF